MIPSFVLRTHKMHLTRKLSAYCHGVDPKKKRLFLLNFSSYYRRKKKKTELNSIRQQN